MGCCSYEEIRNKEFLAWDKEARRIAATDKEYDEKLKEYWNSISNRKDKNYISSWEEHPVILQAAAYRWYEAKEKELGRALTIIDFLEM